MSIRFSIIIPAYNAEDTIGKCLQSIKNMDYPKDNYEIIVVDNGSKDNTYNIAEKLGAKVIQGAKLVKGRQFRNTIGALRNLGAKDAKGEILCFLDADIIANKNWLKKVEEYFGRGFNGLLGFATLVPLEAGWVAKSWNNLIRVGRNNIKEVDFLDGRNLAIKKDIHNKCRGFDENLKTGEDKDYTLRVLQAGYKVIFDSTLTFLNLGYEKNLLEFIKKEWWRQGNTLFMARKWKYKFRLLRNPLLGLFHLICIIAIFSSLLLWNNKILVISIFFWVLPSLLILIKKMNIRKYWRFLHPIWFLTFLRWNVVGFALIPQLVSLLKEKCTTK